jgi:GT2 family glycosyltransferase
MRFLRLRYGRLWTGWASWRMWRRAQPLGAALAAWRRPQPAGVVVPIGFMHPLEAPVAPPPAVPPTVTVLIPTLDRYPQLFNLLAQLREQTAPPLEIIVIDQTAAGARDATWPERFTDLPLRVIWRDRAGQCSSRNAGLRAARGETILFLDDDDEIRPDLIARHLAFLARFGVDASCGVAEEVGAGALPAEFGLIRDSDVFPTNNTLLRAAALGRSGLFDLAYERGERADHDLGMRLYLSGAQLALNPAASVVHLHAPRGGLRQHRARVVTRSASRASIWYRQLLAPTEAYLWLRYFTAAQVREAVAIRTIGSLRGSGRGPRRLLRAAAMLLLLPDTWRQNRARLARGRAMLDDHPTIPTHQPAAAEEYLTA